MSEESQHRTPEVAAKVAYELRMFEHVYERLTCLDVEMDCVSPGNVNLRLGTGISTMEERDSSALVESFLLHARVLAEFFCSEGRKDDIVAADFIPGWIRPTSSDWPYTEGCKTRLNKALAHLTMRRVTEYQTAEPWDIAKMKSELDNVIRRFHVELPVEMQPWFQDE